MYSAAVSRNRDDLSLSAMDLMEPCGIPLSLHNLWVALLMLAMFAWFLQVLYRICKAQIIHWRMRRSERGLLLDRMSIYGTDLQSIIRQHFNQLLRIRPSVPAREIAQLYVLAHLHPESLRSEIVDGEKPGLILVHPGGEMDLTLISSCFLNITPSS